MGWMSITSSAKRKELSMSENKCETGKLITSLIDQIAKLNQHLTFLQMSLDLLEDRVTELEQHVTGEYEISADFELE